MPTAKYMQEYWKNNPDKYEKHKSRVKNWKKRRNSQIEIKTENRKTKSKIYKKICNNCGKSFNTTYSQKKTCSNKCSYLYSKTTMKRCNNEHTKTYNIDKKRKSILLKLALKQQLLPKIKLAQSCFACGQTDKLLRHHITYNPPETITLCPSCHAILHYISRKLQKNIISNTKL